MEEIILQLDELRLSLKIINHTVSGAGEPYENWIKCDVTANCRSFSASFPWEVMPSELLLLANRLMEMYDQFPKHSILNFQSTEPGISLTFEIGSHGQVEGKFDFRDQPVNYVALNGSFVIEQSHLKTVAGDLRKLVHLATASAA